MGTATLLMSDDRSSPGLGEARAGSGGSDVRLTLPARPENVAVVRHVLGAFAEALQLPDPVIEDMRLAVTEACTNVVRHAYARRRARAGRDPHPPRGRRARRSSCPTRAAASGPSPDTAGPGLGLPLIAALADSLEIEQAPSARLAACAMSFLRRPRWGSRDDGPQAAGEPLTTVSIAAGPLVGPVLRRVVGMLAARADLPLDRLDDAVLVADLIAARAPAHVAGSASTSRSSPAPRSLLAARRPAARRRRRGADRRRRRARRRQRDRAARRRADASSPEDDGEFLLVRLAYAATTA